MLYWAIVIIIAVVAGALRVPFVKGFIGETIVKIILGKNSEKAGKEKFVINNFLIQLETGKTSQTDHILINQNGVFVIETKNYSGRIYGDDVRKEWTQVLSNGNIKNKFYSPVKQNATHVYHIKQLLPPETPIYSVVVFVKGNTEFIKSDHVYNLFELMHLIKEKSDTPLSTESIKALYNILSQHDKSDEITNEEHIQNIMEMQEKISNNICPRCGGTLVERHGKNGAFWGCSNFPKCRFTKS